MYLQGLDSIWDKIGIQEIFIGWMNEWVIIVRLVQEAVDRMTRN